MRGTLLSLGMTVVLAGCATGPVVAEVEVADSLAPPTSSKTPSAQHLEQGLRLYAEKRFVEAAEAFEEAYRNGGSTPALFAEGQSLQMAGDCAAAMEVFEQLLLVEPDPTYAHVVNDLMEACH